MEKHYIVEFDFFDPSVKNTHVFDERQNKIIDLFKSTNRVLSLSVSESEAIMWVVIRVQSESELVFLMDSLDFPDECDYDYFELNMHVSINTFESYSLN
mgnify:CR=1 FL=1|jgi:hypothetical protein